MADDTLGKKKKRRVTWIAVACVSCGVAFVFVAPILNTLADFNREGFFEKPEQKEYHATSMQNLKALYQAMQLYFDSEGVAPQASGWMDAANIYLKTADLKKGEELKKFVNPRLDGGKEVFGYGYNAALSAVYFDEISDPATTPLIFESLDTKWNAFGDPYELQPRPELPGGNQTVTVDGSVATLKKLLDVKN